MSEHTPGPWTTFMDGQGLWAVQDGGSGRLLAVGLSQPDARRIAAAPDMEEILKAIEAHASFCYCGGKTESFLDDIRAVLAKARGE